jgi:hypothetical protein
VGIEIIREVTIEVMKQAEKGNDWPSLKVNRLSPTLMIGGIVLLFLLIKFLN